MIQVVPGQSLKVRDKEERLWTLQADVALRSRNVADDFEHDISSGRGPAIVLLTIVIVLAVILVVWTPPDVVVPLWLILIILLIGLFFPVRWALRRQWTIIAAYGDTPEGAPVETWVGTVRGMLKVRPQMRRIARNIQSGVGPGGDGLMKRNAPPVPAPAPDPGSDDD